MKRKREKRNTCLKNECLENECIQHEYDSCIEEKKNLFIIRESTFYLNNFSKIPSAS